MSLRVQGFRPVPVYEGVTFHLLPPFFPIVFASRFHPDSPAEDSDYRALNVQLYHIRRTGWSVSAPPPFLLLLVSRRSLLFQTLQRPTLF